MINFSSNANKNNNTIIKQQHITKKNALTACTHDEGLRENFMASFFFKVFFAVFFTRRENVATYGVGLLMCLYSSFLTSRSSASSAT